MADSIKLHIYTGPDDGQNADYRNPDGTERLGAAEGDHHKTVFEIDPAPADVVDMVLHLGPQINRLFQRMNPASGAEVLGLQAPKLRIGVWPGDGRA